MVGPHSLRPSPEPHFAVGDRKHFVPAQPRQNHLLASLPLQDYDRLLPNLEPFPLPLGWAVHDAGDRVRRAPAGDPDALASEIRDRDQLHRRGRVARLVAAGRLLLPGHQVAGRDPGPSGCTCSRSRDCGLRRGRPGHRRAIARSGHRDVRGDAGSRGDPGRGRQLGRSGCGLSGANRPAGLPAGAT